MAGLLVDAAADIDTAACADDEPEGAVMLPVDMTDSVKSAVISELSQGRATRCVFCLRFRCALVQTYRIGSCALAAPQGPNLQLRRIVRSTSIGENRKSADDSRRRHGLDQSISSLDMTGMTAVRLLQIPILFWSAASRTLVQSPTVSRMWTEQNARPHLRNQKLHHLAIHTSGDCMFLTHLVVDEDGDKFTMR